MTGSVFSPDYEPEIFKNEWAFPGITSQRLESPAGSVFSPDYEPEIFKMEWSFPYISNIEPVNPNWPAANPPKEYVSNVEQAVKEQPAPPTQATASIAVVEQIKSNPWSKALPIIGIIVAGVIVYYVFIRKK